MKKYSGPAKIVPVCSKMSPGGSFRSGCAHPVGSQRGCDQSQAICTIKLFICSGLKRKRPVLVLSSDTWGTLHQ